MMTHYSDPSAFRTGSRAEQTERFVALSRLALLWERIWPGLWPASGIAGLFAAAALFDLFEPLPWTAHALILSGAITAIGLALYFGLRDMRIPDWTEGARRLERGSGFAHRPISEANDRMAAGLGDGWAEALWKFHLAQRLANIGKFRIALPSPGLARRDPRASRFAILLLLIASLLVAGSDWSRRLWAGFNDTGSGAVSTVDAWIDPPAYTGLAPLYLTDGMVAAVPAGSTLNLRVHGAGHTPGLALNAMSESDNGFTGANGEYSATWTVRSDAQVRVRSNGRAIGEWSLTAIADKPPTISFAAPPGKTEHAALKLSYKASDDYGVAAIRAVITPHGKHGKPLIVDLPLAGPSEKSVAETTFRDLTAHPYAGLNVDIVLQATDGAGQTAATKPVQYTLPARVFTNPLARALVEQRQLLATSNTPQDRSRVVRILDALSIAPELFYANASGVYTGIRAARWALSNAKRGEEVDHVEDLLWQIAIGLERGGLLSAAEELRRIQAMLSQALAQGAPQEVIDELLQRYNEAMQRYMQALAANPQEAQGPPPDAKVLNQNDLQTLLKAIQQLAQSGDRAQAQQLLALLQSLLENLRLGGAGQGGNGQANNPQNKALSDAIQGLGDLMGKQRGLLDKTFRGQQGEAVKPGDLSKEQGDIGNQLNAILKGLGGQKIPPPADLGRAGRSMGQSQQELGSSDLPGSAIDQKNALDAMRSAATDLANKLMKQMGQDQSKQGDEDPLGRKDGANGSNLGGDVKVPTQSELQRARDILQELRRRAGERGRPQQELDYIDRLLKQF
jgi:uncharacterized protein (TIGR02302 family)